MSITKAVLNILVVAVVGLMPLAALANDATLLGPGAAVSGVSNPSASTSTTGPASPDTSTTLQPAGASSGNNLQPGGDATGLSANSSAQSVLQQPASQDQAKLFIQGDTDTSSNDPSSPWTMPWWLAFLISLLALGVGIFGWWLLGRGRTRPVPQPATETGPATVPTAAESPLAPESSSESAQPITPSYRRRAKKRRRR